MEVIRIVQIGLGAIGQKITRYLTERKTQFKIVGAMDMDPRKVGKDLGTVCGMKKKLGVPVVASLSEALRREQPDVAIVATVSDLKRITPQIEAIATQGIHVISTCEELSCPWTLAPALAHRIDAIAKQNKAAVLGTGVNPGFMMDVLPTALTAVCQRVDRIRVSRIQNAAFRRLPFQKKIGAGLTLKEFEEKRKEGALCHVGLAESISMMAERMGWKLTKIEDNLIPIVARKPIRAKAIMIQRGRVAGVQQIGKGFVGDEEKITLVFRASVGESKPQDTVEIFGDPAVVSTIVGGVNGDIATCAITINAVKQVLRASPGLKTMMDIPVVSYFSK